MIGLTNWLKIKLANRNFIYSKLLYDIVTTFNT